jgi:hypothetical protein
MSTVTTTPPSPQHSIRSSALPRPHGLAVRMGLVARQRLQLRLPGLASRRRPAPRGRPRSAPARRERRRGSHRPGGTAEAAVHVTQQELSSRRKTEGPVRLGVDVRMLKGVEVGYALRQPAQLPAVLHRWFRAMNALHEAHGIDEAFNRAQSAAVIEALRGWT